MTSTESSEVRVKNIRRYKTFEEMLKIETWNSIAPDAKSCEEVFFLLKQIYPPQKEKLGVVVFEFTKVAK